MNLRVYTVNVPSGIDGVNPASGTKCKYHHFQIVSSSFERALAAFRKAYPDVAVREIQDWSYSGTYGNLVLDVAP